MRKNEKKELVKTIKRIKKLRKSTQHIWRDNPVLEDYGKLELI